MPEIGPRSRTEKTTSFEQFDYMTIAIGQFFLYPRSRPISSIVGTKLTERIAIITKIKYQSIQTKSV